MIIINMQYFGNKGSSSGKSGGAGGAPRDINPDVEKAKKATAIPEGTYIDEDGEEHTVEYRYPNKNAVEIYVDGEPSGKVYQQYDGEWRAEYNGETTAHKNPKSAARKAWGTPEEWGLKKKKK